MVSGGRPSLWEAYGRSTYPDPPLSLPPPSPPPPLPPPPPCPVPPRSPLPPPRPPPRREAAQWRAVEGAVGEATRDAVGNAGEVTRDGETAVRMRSAYFGAGDLDRAWRLQEIGAGDQSTGPAVTDPGPATTVDSGGSVTTILGLPRMRSASEVEADMGTVAADLPAAEAWVDEWVDALAAENDELSLRCTTSDATADGLNARCASLQGDVAPNPSITSLSTSPSLSLSLSLTLSLSLNLTLNLTLTRCASLQGDVARLQRELDDARAEAAEAAVRQQEFVSAGRARITLLRDQV